MSEEISPAPLRLKPRAQPDAAPASASATTNTLVNNAPAAVPPSPPIDSLPSAIQEVRSDEPLSTREAAARVAESTAEPLRFKLKPKTAAPGESPKVAGSANAGSPETGAADAAEAAKFRLKPKMSLSSEAVSTPPPPVPPKTVAPVIQPSAPSTAVATAPVAVPAAVSPMPSPAPVVPMVPQPSLPSPQATAPSKVPFVQAARGVSEKDLSKRLQTEKPAGFKGGALAIGGLTVILLGVVVVFSYGIYQKLSKSKHDTAAITATPPVAAKPAPAAAAPAASTALKPGQIVVDNPTSDAGKLVAKARDTVAAHDGSGLVQGVNEVLDNSPAAAAAKTAAPAQAPSASAPAAAEEPLAPPPPVEEPPPEPSRGFRDFVVNMRVNGVFQGSPARALLNGKMAHEGEIVDFKLGITLFQVDPQKKLLLFKDATGASMNRRY